MEQTSKLKTNKGERKYTVLVSDSLSKAFWDFVSLCFLVSFVCLFFPPVFTRDKSNHTVINSVGKELHASSSPVSCSKQFYSEQIAQGTSSGDLNTYKSLQSL